jgi:chromosome segregation ATPase
MLNPIEDTPSRDVVEAPACLAEARAAAAEAEQIRLRREVDTVRDQIVATVASLGADQLELAAVKGEVKGHLAANVMTERACAELRGLCVELRAQLSMGRCAEAAARRELLSVQAELAEALETARRCEARIVNMLASHSWKVTAPLRRLGRVLYRRS